MIVWNCATFCIDLFRFTLTADYIAEGGVKTLKSLLVQISDLRRGVGTWKLLLSFLSKDIETPEQMCYNKRKVLNVIAASSLSKTDTSDSWLS